MELTIHFTNLQIGIYFPALLTRSAVTFGSATFALLDGAAEALLLYRVEIIPGDALATNVFADALFTFEYVARFTIICFFVIVITIFTSFALANVSFAIQAIRNLTFLVFFEQLKL